MTRATTTPIRADFLRTLLVVGLTVGSAGCGPDGSTASRGLDAYEAVQVTDASGASMGSVAFPVSCGEAASEEMRLGLALLHNMTYTAAEAAFVRAAEIQPDCALAYWGMAMTSVHPVWPDVTSDEDLQKGWDLLQAARRHGPPTAREEAFVEALEAYYRDAASRDEPTRLARYADAWASVRSDHPDDPEAALFGALTMIATAPGSGRVLERKTDAGEVAEQVLEVIPDHPGAHHYVIHAFDEPPLSGRALPVARNYGAVAPENSHALHMTSHIFTREGLWEESIDYNERAADIALSEPVAGQISHHYLHAVDYLAYAHLQRGADELAQEVLHHLRTLEGPVVNNAVSAYAFAAVEARIALEQGDWARAAALGERQPRSITWDSYPHLEAIPVFARALGAARSGDVAAARRSADRLSELRTRAGDVPDAYDWAAQVQVQEMGALAWISYAEGRTVEAVSLMREAAVLESTTQKHPVTPAEALPAGELLGDMLMEVEEYQDALDAYSQALERNRNRFNSLYGAGRAAELLGREAIAVEYYQRLLDMAGSSTSRRATLEGVERFLARGG